MSRIVLLGDSITQGLGSQKVNFTSELEALRPDDEIINMALTGTTIKYACDHVKDILAAKPDMVIILYGNVDAQIRPSRSGKIFRLLPSRFAHKDGSMLLPRPFYSKTFIKRFAQHIENFMRSFFRNLIYAVDGKEQWVDVDKFNNLYTWFCDELSKHNIDIICCSTVYLDDDKFPGSNKEYIIFNSVIERISQGNNKHFLDIYNPLKKLVYKYGWGNVYNYDHFHPKGYGYKYIAKWINEKIEEVKEPECIED